MRCIKKLTSLTALGPTEERNAGLWVGYDVEGVDDDLEAHGLIRVDDWTDDQLTARGVRAFTRVEPETLGLKRKR